MNKLTKHPHQKLAKLPDLQVDTIETDIVPLPPSPTPIADASQETNYNPIYYISWWISSKPNDHQLIDAQYFDVSIPTVDFSTTPLQSNS